MGAINETFGLLQESLKPFGITPDGANLIIIFTIASIIVGYFSMLALTLEKKEGFFSSFKYYEKFIFSFIIGGISVYFSSVFMMSMSIVFGTFANNSMISSVTLLLITLFFASMAAPFILNILIKKETMKFGTILQYAVIMIFFPLAIFFFSLLCILWRPNEITFFNKIVPSTFLIIAILFFMWIVVSTLNLKKS